MEREKFERSWKDAFEKAELNPDDQVWTNIELELERQRGGELKRRLLFYKMLAAASVVFALTVAGVGYFHMTELRQDAQLVLQDKTTTSASDGKDTTLQTPDQPGDTRTEPMARADEKATDRSQKAPNGSAALADASALRRIQSPARERGDTHSRSALSRATAAADDRPRLPGPNDLPSTLDAERLPPLYAADRRFDSALRQIKDYEKESVDPVVAMLARLEQRERDLQTEDGHEERPDSQHEQLWTSVGVAAGSFNTMHASTSNMRMLSASAQNVAAPIVDREAKASGLSYSMGVNVGTRISDRWVLQGGVNYLTQASEYTTDNVVMTSTGYSSRFMAAHSNALVGADERDINQKIVYSAPYTVNNSMRYLSIPMQAGYLLVDKAFGVQVNAGVATDLFLQNTVKADSDQLARSSQPAGEDSPYRAVNLSGLFGTEFSYRFAENYRVSLNPGIRYPFNTIYKSELGIQSTPVTFDIGLRFRYIFH